MDSLLPLLLIAAMVATFLIVVGITMPTETRSASQIAMEQALGANRQYRARIMGNNSSLMPLMQAAVKRANKTDGTNQQFLRWLKQANWYWAPGEAAPPSPAAPFWNLETMWGEKIIRASMYGGTVFAIVAFVGMIYGPLFFNTTIAPGLIAALVLGGGVAFVGFGEPDGAVADTSASRQRELGLEMGFRIAELRSDVLAGYTIQRAIRNMAARPGGPFIEELRRIVMVLNTTKDESAAMDAFMERNSGSEIVQEFANQIKMVTREGGEIAPALNVLTEAAQNRLRQQITQQGRKNLADMSRPVGVVSMLVTFMLIIIPVVFSIISTLNTF